ncbi:MAG: hypothetical protein NWF05_04415 [Candidatus Bathyarchaeota archaeon]|nr:hypothetical protein [Candidatus Bathyarchaeota archaeon]
MRKQAVVAVSTLLLFVTAMSAVVYAETTYTVTILDPSSHGGLGISYSGHWVGQIPIRITSGSTTYQTLSYCMDPDRTVYIGSTYTATLTTASDTSTWRAVSYVLSWYDPGNSHDAAVDQVAIWKLLDPGYVSEPWLDVTVNNEGTTLANIASGKDVVRQGDNLSWVAPITVDGASVQGSPGQTLTFTAQLKDAVGTPRLNVKVQFTATLNSDGSSIQLNSTYVVPAEGFTDSQGMVQVAVQVPSDTALGSTIQIQAATHSVWPQRYVDLTNPDNQDLIGIEDTFGLTTSTNICILGHITVVPESAFGALSALTAFAAAFAIWSKVKKTKIP